MAEKRMLIVDADVVEKINENRGDMSCSEFLSFLIDGQLKEEPVNQNYVSKEDFAEYAAGIKELLRNFLDFFLSYGLELGKQPQDKTFEELTQTLRAMGNSGKGKNR